MYWFKDLFCTVFSNAVHRVNLSTGLIPIWSFHRMKITIAKQWNKLIADRKRGLWKRRDYKENWDETRELKIGWCVEFIFFNWMSFSWVFIWEYAWIEKGENAWCLKWMGVKYCCHKNKTQWRFDWKSIEKFRNCRTRTHWANHKDAQLQYTFDGRRIELVWRARVYFHQIDLLVGYFEQNASNRRMNHEL